MVSASATRPFSGYLLWELVRRRLTGAYAAAVVGPVWQLVQPILAVVLLTLVFGRWVAIDGSDHEGLAQGRSVRYGILLCCGLLPWRSISQTITGSASLFVVHSQFLRRTRVSSIVYVWVELLAAALQFVLVFGVFLAIAACAGLRPGAAWIQLAPLVFLQLAITFGLQLGSAAVGVFVRDLQHAYSVLFQILFWVTPIAYRSSDIYTRAPRWMLDANPLWYLVRSYRDVVVRGEWLPLPLWLGLAGAAAGVLAAGSLVYRKLEPDIPDFV